MNILNISAQKPDSTGSGVYLTATATAMVHAGHNVAVIAGVTQADPNPLPAEVHYRPVYYQTDKLPFPVLGMSDVMPYESTRYKDLTPQMVKQFEQAFIDALDDVLESFQPDVIICHHLYLMTTIVREHLPDARVIAISHSTDLRQMRSHNLERDRIISAIRDLDGIFALHEEQKQQIIEIYGVRPEDITVIGTAYDDSVFNCALCPVGERYEKKPGHVDLIYAGKIAEAKGLLNLIPALDRLPYDPEHLTLRMAGGFSSQEEYDKIILKAQSSPYPIKFLGKLNHEQLSCDYQRSDVFILPSYSEGLPLVVIEALACGCKVVMTDLPGIKPWIETVLPGAPVVYVEPPVMLDVNTPEPSSEPAFQQRLADAIQEALALPADPVDVTHLSWDALGERMVGYSQEIVSAKENPRP